jgi:carbamoyltransferase
MAHAASAYYTSGWNKCLVVVCDGMGEAHSMSVYHACNGRLDLIDQVSALDSIGILYSLVTLHLGFDFNSDEYKVMGLAPYGDSERYRSFFDEAVIVRDGKVRIPLLRLNRSNDERHLYLASRAYLATHLPPERLPGEELTIEHCDVAAALQACLDRFMTQICGHYGRTLGQRRLALAGGVALNCTANGKLLRSGDFDEVYVQPAAGDDGSALGAALWRAAFHDEAHNQRMATPFIGPRHSSDSVERAIRNFGDRIEITRFPSLETACDDAARLIAAGRVLGWYRGRMEFGPRALGHRSILADPAHPEMRERINAMVKMREAFRPFAPSVTLEEVDRWFVVPPGTALPYMIMIVEVRPEHRASLPAVTHVDGTARVQSVSAADDPDFHTLLKAIGRHTGRELVLNTSFNIKGQPIVDTPSDAVETFLSTGIQHLYLENIRLDRRS